VVDVLVTLHVYGIDVTSVEHSFLWESYVNTVHPVLRQQ
jgi:hypothetical protein